MNYITRDITTVESPAIIMHGVNCQRVMQSGVAKSLFMKWPQVREDYMRFSKKEIFLGKIAPIEIENNIFVINCWTQEQYGYDNKTYASISAIKICLEAVINFSLEKNIMDIYSPRIGCGHGGLGWETDVQKIFYDLEQKYKKIQLTICDLN